MIKKLFFILFFISGICFSQIENQIKQKNTQLESLKGKINSLKNDLKESNKVEAESYKSIQNIDQQIILIQKLISNYRSQEKEIGQEVQKLRKLIKGTEDNVSTLEKEYSKFVVWMYKFGSSSKLNYLFSAKSFNQMLIRYKYLDVITTNAESIKKKLVSDRSLLLTKKNRLERALSKQKILIQEKSSQKNELSNTKQEKNDLIAKLDKDQMQIESEIKAKRRSEVEIKNIVASLYEEQRRLLAKSREAELKGKKTDIITYNYDKFENFVSLKGKMNWPVRTGKISRKFGENRNEKLKTITLNYGVDINTKKNSPVYAVAQGVVSKIDWIPGFGSIIILTHKGEYRTVYGHISNIYVNEGQIIKGGTKLGIVNQTLEGNLIHFEVWNERNYQNPQDWLAKK